MEKTKLEARLEFLMSQLHRAADLKIKFETNRVGSFWESQNPLDEISRVYKKTLQEAFPEVSNEKE